MERDNDTRHLRVVQAKPQPPQKTAAAEAAARYRARKRGEQVPKRRPGPKPKTANVLRQELRDLRAEHEQLKLLHRIASERLERRTNMLTVKQLVGELLDVLHRDPAAKLDAESVERRVLLGDLAAEIEARQELWPER